jgi:hypothetical protein
MDTNLDLLSLNVRGLGDHKKKNGSKKYVEGHFLQNYLLSRNEITRY